MDTVPFQHDQIVQMSAKFVFIANRKYLRYIGTASNLGIDRSDSCFRGVERLGHYIFPEGIPLNLWCLVELIIDHAQSHLKISVKNPVRLKVAESFD